MDNIWDKFLLALLVAGYLNIILKSFNVTRHSEQSRGQNLGHFGDKGDKVL